MVDFTTQYDEYDLDFEACEERESRLSGARKLATIKRDLTGQERYARQARFRRKRSGQNYNGAARRRDKRNYL